MALSVSSASLPSLTGPDPINTADRGLQTDSLVEAIRGALHNVFLINTTKDERTQQSRYTFQCFQNLIDDYRAAPEDQRAQTRLAQLCRGVADFFTPLPLVKAFDIYDSKYCMTSRQFVGPSTDEVRHILNVAQVLALRDSVRLITFDGDETLYSDGQFFNDVKLASFLTQLLKSNVNIALVTAAGYGYDHEKYEGRIRGLLDFFRQQKIKPHVVSRFFVLGAECNFLFRCNGSDDYHLSPVFEDEWKPLQPGFRFDEAQCKTLLDLAQSTMEDAMKDLKLRVKLIRKEKAVGIVPGGYEGRHLVPEGSGAGGLRREILDEVVLRIKDAIRQAGLTVPFCAFNGGNDSWVDVGNKFVGVLGLQHYLDLKPHECLHVGDQFLNTGNDRATRSCATTVWIKNPEETKAVLRALLRVLKLHWRTDLCLDRRLTNELTSSGKLHLHPLGDSSTAQSTKAVVIEDRDGTEEDSDDDQC
ncbi:unnamed protein product [Vitrella brassicaformis CCMP3155]|uniref:IMP-specific 5'-nucleotidase 1 n=1 Tax=Vitrella brassicaformis (strain CCMP3155) TaxID=1169540 RepID=A0A0G4FAV4_VITBC|nr:unnamed protein product [Vitrella brassicaformis CCMP3155]|eukprot:CEM09774.1 unnamed protein product [Vitrella brassicaformis CCMP3155]